jgi:hypothetical protein
MKIWGVYSPSPLGGTIMRLNPVGIESREHTLGAIQIGSDRSGLPPREADEVKEKTPLRSRNIAARRALLEGADLFACAIVFGFNLQPSVGRTEAVHARPGIGARLVAPFAPHRHAVSLR